MKPFHINEMYNCNSEKILSCMLSKKYYNYIIKNIKDMDSYNFRYINYDLSQNKIDTVIEYNLKLDVPSWIKELSKTDNYYTIETSCYDLSKNNVDVIVNMPNLPMNHLVTIKYNYKLINKKNICNKLYTFYINCSLNLLKTPIELLIKKIILQKIKLKYKLTKQFLEL
jgi:hypothetical protein